MLGARDPRVPAPMRPIHSKTNPRVRDGKVQRKNRTALTTHYNNTELDGTVVHRERPGVGYRHVLRKRDVECFLALLPDWSELARDLDAVILAPGEDDCLGWYGWRIAAVCAWERELAGECSVAFVSEHEAVLERLEVPVEKRRRGSRWVGWTERSVRDFQLLHVLLHELGHHHDRMTTASQLRAARGEDYAESYALRHAEEIWARYGRVFR